MQTISVESYYDVLGVDQGASFGEIKKAYFTKIREFPNETHPDQFQLLSKAYKILMDTDAKKQYDLELNGNGSYRVMLDRADDAMNRGNHNAALGMLLEMLNTYPNDLETQQMMAICYNNLGRYDDAKRLLFRLESSYPNNERTLYWLGETFLNLKMFHKAKVYYEKLIILNPKEANYYISLAASYYHLGDFDTAIRILQEKLNKGKETIYDFPLLEQLFYITMVADKLTYHRDIIKRIKNLYSSNAEKEQLLSMLIRSCESLDHDNNGYKGLVLLVKDINSNQDREVNQWLVKAEANIRRDLIYYGDSSPAHTGYSSHTNQTHYNNNSSSTVTTYEDDERGSILFSVIFGIIASFFLTPIGGIVVGIIWYYNAAAIKKLLAVLASIILILVIVAIFIFSNM